MAKGTEERLIMSRILSGVMTALCLGLVFQTVGKSATRTAASCSQSDVQAAVNSAARGDTVIIPSGSCAWTSGITVAAKAIILKGQGSGRIIAYSPDSLTVGTGAKSINIQAGLSIAIGQTLRISQTGKRSNWMQGSVSSYSGSVLTMNITSTAGSGTARRWLVSTMPTTTITHNSGTTLFSITEDTLGHIDVSGIKVAAGTGGADVFTFNRTSGGRAILLHDCWIEQGSAGGDAIQAYTNSGVVYNCSFDSSPFSMAPLAFHHQPFNSTSSWTTASTMGAADTTGESNFYFENCDFHAYLNAADIDNNARAVFRYNLFNNAGFGTHGADTSTHGQRHFEFYNNTGVFDGYSDGSTFSMNWWFYVRGGTFVIANNVLPRITSTDYPNYPDVNMTVMNLQRNSGPNPCWAADYPVPRQVGRGFQTGTGTDGKGRTYDSVTFVGDLEPGYAWGNSRPGGGPVALVFTTSDYGECNTGTKSSTYVQSNRDYFNGATAAKPGWAPYAYPHPLRAADPPPPPSSDTTPPSTPASLAATVVSSSQINLSWAASTDNVAVQDYRLERCQGASCTDFAQIAVVATTAYSDTGLTAGIAYRYRVRASDASGNLSGYSVVANATTQSGGAGSPPSPLPSGNSGIAALYPGDANIQSHPDVLFADGFEAYTSAAQLTSQYNSYYQSGNTRIATEPANVFAGSRALEFTLQQVSSEVANAVIKKISPTQDVLFVRVYTKFDSGFDVTSPGHNGIRISARYAGPGIVPNGTDFFLFSLENSIYYGEQEPGYTHIYCYHPEQRQQYGDSWYSDGKILPYDSVPGDFGSYFVARQNIIPERNRWYSYELMVKANTPGQRDGRVAVWVDGNLVADFQNVRVRDIADLKIDEIQLELHAQASALRSNKKWYDNLVVSRSYIGPMVAPGSVVAPPSGLSATVR